MTILTHLDTNSSDTVLTIADGNGWPTVLTAPTLQMLQGCYELIFHYIKNIHHSLSVSTFFFVKTCHVLHTGNTQISLYFVSSKQLQELTFGNTHVVNSVFCSSKVTQRVHVLKYFCWNISIQDKIAKIYEPDLCMSIWYIAHVRLYGFRCMFALLRS